jgi:hypothetical protein
MCPSLSKPNLFVLMGAITNVPLIESVFP